MGSMVHGIHVHGYYALVMVSIFELIYAHNVIDARL
jgi:hypothetical protein